ncbi:hypothetical protein D3C75_654910 [compost metagenome]
MAPLFPENELEINLPGAVPKASLFIAREGSFKISGIFVSSIAFSRMSYSVFKKLCEASEGPPVSAVNRDAAGSLSPNSVTALLPNELGVVNNEAAGTFPFNVSETFVFTFASA